MVQKVYFNGGSSFSHGWSMAFLVNSDLEAASTMLEYRSRKQIAGRIIPLAHGLAKIMYVVVEDTFLPKLSSPELL